MGSCCSCCLTADKEDDKKLNLLKNELQTRNSSSLAPPKQEDSTKDEDICSQQKDSVMFPNSQQRDSVMSPMAETTAADGIVDDYNDKVFVDEIKEDYVLDGRKFLSFKDGEIMQSFFNQRSSLVGGESVLCEEEFVSAFSTKHCGYIWRHMYISICDTGKHIKYPDFVNFVINVTRTPPHHGMHMLWGAASAHGIHVVDIERDLPKYEVNDETAPLPDILIRVYSMLVVLAEISGCNQGKVCVLATKLLENLQKFLRRSSLVVTELSFEHFMEWVDSMIPCVSNAFHEYIHRIIFPETDQYIPSYVVPALMVEEFEGKKLSSIISQDLIVPISLHITEAQGFWKRLYCAERDGSSFAALGQRLLGYEGPHVVIIKCQNCDAIFGGFNQCSWTESNRMYGDSSAFLFRLEPDFSIYETIGLPNNQNYQYLNISTHGYPHGLGMGGSINKFRIFLPDSMEKCLTTEVCETFENGELLPIELEGEGKIEHIEVWASGGEQTIQKGLLAQLEYRRKREYAIRKKMSTPQAELLTNEFNQQMFFDKTFDRRSEIGEGAVREEMPADRGLPSEDPTTAAVPSVDEGDHETLLQQS